MKKLSVLLLFILSSNIFAASGKMWIVEPLIGYQFGKWNQAREGDDYQVSAAGESKGLVLGAKVSYVWKILIFGMGYYRANLNMSYNKEDDDFDEDWDESIAVTHSYIPIYLGFLGSGGKYGFKMGYLYSNNYTTQAEFNEDEDGYDYTGTGMMYEMSWGVKSNMRILFSYTTNDFEERGEDDDVEYDPLYYQQYMIGASFPFTF